ncbi:uncharacterized protein [Dermacentor albipictus]|uniref:uncharacterized protein n=1 Tax=Dermacentor albipictus TaxID=60249 RepID=UPI0031FC4C87
MTASHVSESGAVPGDAIGDAARRPEVVVVRDVDHRGYQCIGQRPSGALKVFHRLPRTSGFSTTFTFVCKTVVLLVLKLYLAFLLLHYLYRLPQLPIDRFPDRLFEIGEILLGVAAVAGAESLWSRKSNVALLASRYFEAPEGGGRFEPGQSLQRPQSFWHDKFIPLLLFGHALAGVSLYFASNICPWTREGIANYSFLEAFTRFFFVNLLALSQAYMAMTIYTVFCVDVRRTMQCATEELQRRRDSITHDGLRRLHRKWELCCRYLGDLNYNFLGFVCAWYCYLFVRAIYLVALVSSTVFPASRAALTRQELCVPLFELTYLAILCAVSGKVKDTLYSPVEHLRELTLSRPTEETAIHIEVQRFLYRISKYTSMTLWKLSMWTENAFKIFVLVVAALLVLHDKRVRAKLL